MENSADLVLTYGTKVVTALAGRGVGPDTAIRILYCDNLRVNGTNVASRWDIRVDGKSPPGGAIYQDNYGSAGNYHKPCTIAGYATGLAAGNLDRQDT